MDNDSLVRPPTRASADCWQLKGAFLSTSEGPIVVRSIGRVESPLTDSDLAPLQGDEGAPDAWLVFDQDVSEGLRDLRADTDVIVPASIRDLFSPFSASS